MPKLYLIGGENIQHRSAQFINTKAFTDAGRNPTVLVIPWANAGFDQQYPKRKMLIDYFRSLGAEEIIFADYDHFENLQERLDQSDLIYLSGGQTTALIERLRKFGLERQLRGYHGIIVGRSAGALALCNRCLTTCRSNKKTKIIEGLGIVNITMKAHYQNKKDEILKRLSFEQKIFAVPSKSAIVKENNELSVIGTVYLFHKGDMQIFTKANLREVV